MWSRLSSVLFGVILVTLGCERDNVNYRPPVDLTSGQDMGNGPLCGKTDNMAHVKAGEFQMGDANYPTEMPVHSQTLTAFWLDQTEVTMADYAKCVAVGACTAADGAANSQYCNTGVAGKEQHPINCEDFYQASAYCAWQCKRLPTEVEWEYAARGTPASVYPWGNDPPNTIGKPQTDLCWNKRSVGTCPVKSYPMSSTLLGAIAGGGLYDMPGNVVEWTTSYSRCKYPLDQKKPADLLTCGAITNESKRVVRGAYWEDINPAVVRGASRYSFPPLERIVSVGFRCLRPG